MRLFIAVNLPDAEKARLYDALSTLRGLALPLRWLRPETYHLTLSFLGEVDEARLPELSGVVNGVAARHAPFDIALREMGAFPNLRRPRVVWIGVTDASPLLALQDDMATELVPLGFPREARSWSPHLTLARAKLGATRADFATLASHVDDVNYEATIDVESVELMQSRLRRDGAQYERRTSAPLRVTSGSGA